jgi:hypothetical protein
MDSDDTSPLKVGDMVSAEGYDGVIGPVVEHLPDDDVRVKWSDFSAAIRYRARSVQRVAGTDPYPRRRLQYRAS